MVSCQLKCSRYTLLVNLTVYSETLRLRLILATFLFTSPMKNYVLTILLFVIASLFMGILLLKLNSRRPTTLSVNNPSTFPVRQKPKVYNTEALYSTAGKVLILVLLKSNTMSKYKEAQASLQCYAAARNYRLRIVDPETDPKSSSDCKHFNEFMFKRHCVASLYLRDTEWLLMLDADTGVINLNHSVEEYIDDRVQLIFYERFHNGEIMAGNYLVKNTHFGRKFLLDWATYETKLPNVGTHNVDNGALHIHLLRTLLPKKSEEIAKCDEKWHSANTLAQYDEYVGCVKYELGSQRTFPAVKILRRGHGWARDSWISDHRWSSADFMLHAMKPPDNRHFKGPISIDLCTSSSFDFSLPWKPELRVSLEDMKEIIRAADRKALADRPSSLLRYSDIESCWPNC